MPRAGPASRPRYPRPSRSTRSGGGGPVQVTTPPGDHAMASRHGGAGCRSSCTVPESACSEALADAPRRKRLEAGGTRRAHRRRYRKKRGVLRRHSAALSCRRPVNAADQRHARTKDACDRRPPRTSASPERRPRPAMTARIMDNEEEICTPRRQPSLGRGARGRTAA